MKLRNQLLALACLLVFVILGVLYFKAWVVQRPFGVIVFVADNLTPANLAAARLYKGGAGDHLTLEQFDRFALLSNASNDFAVPDAAAAGTAIATGEKVNNRSIATDSRGHELTSILKLAKKAGRAVGIVTNGSFTAPGLAPFYGTGTNPEDAPHFAVQLMEADLGVALGGGSDEFVPESKGGHRKDGRDLTLEMRTRGDEVIRNKAELEAASVVRTSRLVGLFGNGNLMFSEEGQSSGVPSLSDMVRRAIQLLQFNQRGYLLIVDAGLVTHAAQQNLGEHVLSEYLELDAAIAKARQMAGDKSRIFVVGRNTIGGMTLNGYPLRQDHGVALTGKNAFGYPSITWASGPSKREDEPAAVHTSTALDTASDTLVFADGPGTEKLSGFINTKILFQLLVDGL